MKSSAKKQILLAVILYALPIIFFAISYFLNTASGEDIWQGTNNFRTSTTVDPIFDATNAFNHSGRVTDMYAWTIADYFDYQFSFGPDLIFRLLDLIMIGASLYLATYLIINRRPRLKPRDALIFCALFSSIIFTYFGRKLYSEFSMIHNYVPLILITLIFSIPYLRLLTSSSLRGKPSTTSQSKLNKHSAHPLMNHPLFLAIILIPLGLFFGMSTTITPLAFLAATIVYCTFYHKHLHHLPAWFFTGIVSVIIGWCISFFFSSGMGNYTTDPTSAATFDYIALSSIFSAPSTAIPKLLYHLAYNSALLFAPLVVLTLICLILTPSRKQFFTKAYYRTLSPTARHTILIFLIFIIFHLVAATQIKVPPRIFIPAYIAGVILILHQFTPHLMPRLSATIVVIFTTIAVCIHTVFIATYHIQSASVLSEIKNSSEPSLCIEQSRITTPHLPLINLSQEYILVDWGSPEIIYGKTVTFCK